MTVMRNIKTMESQLMTCRTHSEIAALQALMHLIRFGMTIILASTFAALLSSDAFGVVELSGISKYQNASTNTINGAGFQVVETFHSNISTHSDTIMQELEGR